MRYGWLRDAPSAARLGGAPLRKLGQVPSVSMLPNVGEVFDQRLTSSCVAQASAKAIEIVTGIRPSRLAIYSGARIHAGASLHALADDGSIPSHAVSYLADVGVCSESRWPFVEANVNTPAPWDTIQADVGVTGWEKIEGSAAAREAISAGHPVIFGADIRQSYEDYSGGNTPYQGGVDPIVGGHMQTIVGYNGMAWRVMNSWGAGWGDGGFSWVSESWLFGPDCSDFYALSAGVSP